MAQILVVEDDPALASALTRWLNKQGHSVFAAADGITAADQLEFSDFDLLILDVEVPEQNGFEILKSYRQRGGIALALFLTGRSAAKDKITGFETGADDYLTKPFDGKELMLRVEALLKRSRSPIKSSCHEIGLELIAARSAVRQNGKEILLTQKEFAFLEYMLRRIHQIVPSEQILNSIWRDEESASPEALASCISRLRKKLDSDQGKSIIRNLHGRGYQLTNSASAEAE